MSSTSDTADHMPKVRKPYTISKQREKWTEEEHQRFLEGLKLYGRSWRQIEEHVGTKSAVQIRSHAQKFFSKVVRESNGSSTESSIKPIEIPPPRPKRKPMHPYPRKSFDSLKGTSVSNQLERTPSPKICASDAFGSGVSDQQHGCSSPTSCTTENEYVTSNSSRQEEKASALPTQLSGSSTWEESVSMKFEPELKNSVCVEGDANSVQLQPCTSIKLFGKMVLVTDSQKPCLLPISNNSPVDLYAAEACSGASQPVLALHQGLPLVYIVSNNQNPAVRSCAGSSTGSFSEVETRERNSDPDVDFQRRQPFSSARTNSSKCEKGFVPYKRCMAEAEAEGGTKSSMVAAEEQERQRARVCS